MTHTAKRNSDPNLEHPEGAGVCRPIVDLAQGAIRALNGPIWGTCHEVRGRMSIGRSGEADLTILDSAVSRQHALLVADMQGRVVLVDNDSANGVIVGDHRVWCHILSPGDEFSIGNSTFVFEAPGRVDAPWEADSATVAGDDLVSLIARYRALRLRQVRHESLTISEQIKYGVLDARLGPANNLDPRQFQRFRCRIPVEIRIAGMEPLEGTAFNISAEGAKIELGSHGLVPGQWFQLIVQTAVPDVRLAFAACVRWRDEQGVGIVLAGAPKWEDAQTFARRDTDRIGGWDESAANSVDLS